MWRGLLRSTRVGAIGSVFRGVGGGVRLLAHGVGLIVDETAVMTSFTPAP